MTTYKRYYILLALLPALLLISACSPSVGIGTGSSSVTVLQLLQNSAKAMKNLKSAHVETKTNGMLQTISASAPPTASQVTFSVTGSGNEALPAQESLQIRVNQGTNSQPSNLAEIVQGDNVYIQNAKGQWYVLDKSTFEQYIGNPFSDINGLDPNNLLGLLQNTQITNYGDESLNGQSLRHITIAFDKEAFRNIVTNDPQLGNLFGQQNINTLLNSTRKFNTTLDLWIDESTFYIHRTELKFNLNEDVSSLSQSLTPVVTFPLLAGVITSFDSTLNLSNFNAPVTITPPTGAIPTDNPLAIFG